MADPFTLGVASGEPMPDGVLPGPRSAADPLATDPARPGGMPPRAVEVDWQLAEDERFRRGLRQGRVNAPPALDGRRGFLSCVADPGALRVAFRAVDFVGRRDAPVRRVAEFRIDGSGLTSENASSK